MPSWFPRQAKKHPNYLIATLVNTHLIEERHCFTTLKWILTSPKKILSHLDFDNSICDFWTLRDTNDQRCMRRFIDWPVTKFLSTS